MIMVKNTKCVFMIQFIKFILQFIKTVHRILQMLMSYLLSKLGCRISPCSMFNLTQFYVSISNAASLPSNCNLTNCDDKEVEIWRSHRYDNEIQNVYSFYLAKSEYFVATALCMTVVMDSILLYCLSKLKRKDGRQKKLFFIQRCLTDLLMSVVVFVNISIESATPPSFNSYDHQTSTTFRTRLVAEFILDPNEAKTFGIQDMHPESEQYGFNFSIPGYYYIEKKFISAAVVTSLLTALLSTLMVTLLKYTVIVKPFKARRLITFNRCCFIVAVITALSCLAGQSFKVTAGHSVVGCT